jgi:hypothetical protein
MPVGAVVAEINFSRFVGFALAQADDWRQSLLDELQAYRDANR